jgi:hypothetical protein
VAFICPILSIKLSTTGFLGVREIYSGSRQLTQFLILIILKLSSGGKVLKKIIGFLILGLTSCLTARAGVQAEPYLGYWTGTVAQESSSDIAIKGMLYGAKLGLTDTQWKIGLDYLMGTGAGNQGGSTGAYDLRSYGPYVGVEISKWFQLYATYFISAKATLQKDKNPYDFDGSGYRVGIGGYGWGGINRFCINFEYISRTYNKYNSVKLSKELKEQGVGISLSIPFSPFSTISGADDTSSSGE